MSSFVCLSQFEPKNCPPSGQRTKRVWPGADTLMDAPHWHVAVCCFFVCQFFFGWNNRVAPFFFLERPVCHQWRPCEQSVGSDEFFLEGARVVKFGEIVLKFHEILSWVNWVWEWSGRLLWGRGRRRLDVNGKHWQTIDGDTDKWAAIFPRQAAQYEEGALIVITWPRRGLIQLIQQLPLPMIMKAEIELIICWLDTWRMILHDLALL